MKKGLIAVVVVVVVAAVAVAAVMMRNNNKPSSQSTDNGSNSSSSNNSQAVATNTVEIKDMAFSPASITVKKGTTVTWTNKDSISHTVTGDTSGNMNSDTLADGDAYTFTFNQTGTFQYHCNFHSSMHGTVTVTE